MTWPARPSPPLATRSHGCGCGMLGGRVNAKGVAAAARRRGPVGLPVTARAGTDLARRVVHIRPLALDFPEVLVQRLEEDGAIGRHEEMGGPVGLDGHDAPLHPRPEGRLPTGTAQRRLPAPAGGPVARQGLVDPQPFDRPRLDPLHPLIDVAHDADGLLAGGVLRDLAIDCSSGGTRRATSGRGCQQESLGSA